MVLLETLLDFFSRYFPTGLSLLDFFISVEKAVNVLNIFFFKMPQNQTFGFQYLHGISLLAIRETYRLLENLI